METSRTSSAIPGESAPADATANPSTGPSAPTCDNCGADGEIAFTLTTYVEGGGDSVDLHFCSTDCLRAWT